MKWILVFSLLGADLKITYHQIDNNWTTEEACKNDAIMIDILLMQRYGDSFIGGQCRGPIAAGALPWPAPKGAK